MKQTFAFCPIEFMRIFLVPVFSVTIQLHVATLPLIKNTFKPTPLLLQIIDFLKLRFVIKLGKYSIRMQMGMFVKMKFEFVFSWLTTCVHFIVVDVWTFRSHLIALLHTHFIMECIFWEIDHTQLHVEHAILTLLTWDWRPLWDWQQQLMLVPLGTFTIEQLPGKLLQ